MKTKAPKISQIPGTQIYDPLALMRKREISENGLDFILCEMPGPEFSEWQEQISNPETKLQPLEAAMQLLSLCLCYPDGRLVGIEFCRKLPPRLINSWSETALEMIGFGSSSGGQETEIKKD